MENNGSKMKTILSFFKKGISEEQKQVYFNQIKRLVFAVAVLLFSVSFINEAKAEEVKELPQEVIDGIQVHLDAADQEKLSTAGKEDLSQMQMSVVYGDVTETGIKEVNSRETPTYSTYKDVTFRLNDGAITFRVSIYYYYVDGEYAEIYYYAIQKIYEFLVLSHDGERDGFITNYSSSSRLTIYYQVVFYSASEDTYIATIQLDLDCWGDFSCHLALDKKYDLFPNG